MVKSDSEKKVYVEPGLICVCFVSEDVVKTSDGDTDVTIKQQPTDLLN